MRFPKKCGFKPRGRACAAFPFQDGTIAELDDSAVKSLRGEGKNQMTPSYGKVRWNGTPKP